MSTSLPDDSVRRRKPPVTPYGRDADPAGLMLVAPSSVSPGSERRSHRATPSAHHHGPIIEIEDHGRVVVLAGPVRERRTGLVLGGDRADAQRADIGAPGQVGLGEDR